MPPDLEPEIAAPPTVDDHPFVPRDPARPWTLCDVCGFAEAAHTRVAGVTYGQYLVLKNAEL